MGGPTPTVQIVQPPPDTSVTTDSIVVPGTITLGALSGRGVSDSKPPKPGETIRLYAFLITERYAVAASFGAIMQQVANGLGYLSAARPEDLCAALFNRGLRRSSAVLTISSAQPTSTPPWEEPCTHARSAIGTRTSTRSQANHPDTDKWA